MHNSFDDWGRSNVSLAELKPLSYLRALEMCVRDIELYPKDLLFGDQLMDCKIAIGRNFVRPNHWNVHSYPTTLAFICCPSIILGVGGVNMLLKKLNY